MYTAIYIGPYVHRSTTVATVVVTPPPPQRNHPYCYLPFHPIYRIFLIQLFQRIVHFLHIPNILRASQGDERQP